MSQRSQRNTRGGSVNLTIDRRDLRRSDRNRGEFLAALLVVTIDENGIFKPDYVMCLPYFQHQFRTIFGQDIDIDRDRPTTVAEKARGLGQITASGAFDDRDNLRCRIAGNINDISMAEVLIQAAGPLRRLLADRGYDANHLRRLLAQRGAEAVIPSTTSRKTPIPYDTGAYRERNRVERMWCRLKDFRRVATRYDKLARNYLSRVLIAAACAYWLN